MMEVILRERAERAARLFGEGYNCCQSVFAAYADLFGIEQETALKLSCSFGGGMGRMREVCGTVSAMAMAAGMINGNTDPENQQAKTENYALVRKLAESFRREHGTIICRELLGMDKMEDSAAPEKRTRSYYQKRPCQELVRSAAMILGRQLIELDRMKSTRISEKK